MTGPVAEPKETPGGGDLPTGFRGPIMPINTPTGDGRMMLLAADATEAPTRPLPIAFQVQQELAEGHDTAKVAGVVTRTWVDDGMVWGEGRLDLESAAGGEYARQLRDGFAGWVSVDLSDVEVEEVALDADGAVIDIEAVDSAWLEWEAQVVAAEEGGTAPPAPPAEVDVAKVESRFTSWRLMALTAVSSPAFEAARIEAVYGDDLPAVNAEEALVAAAVEHTGAMVALVPSDADLAAMAVEGFEPVTELHCTLAFLGDAAEWGEDARLALETAVREFGLGPIQSEVWGHASFNPDGDDPCAVYLVKGEGLVELRQAVLGSLESLPGIPSIPVQHDPPVFHVTAGYGLPVSDLSYVGPVTFDRLRVAFAGEAVDISLGAAAAMTAAATVFNSADFDMPEPDEVTHLTVDDDGRVFGHLAEWESCHIGFRDMCKVAPSSMSDYRYFHTGEVHTEAGRLPVGRITVDTGHASTEPGMAAAAAAAHYDNTGAVAAVVRCRDGKLGPWLSGRLVPGVSDDHVEKLMRSDVSGDWRTMRRGSNELELVAALAVNVGGFKIPRTRAMAASGQRALVAAGVVAPSRRERIARPKSSAAATGGGSVSDLREIVRATLRELNAEKVLADRGEAAAATMRAARMVSIGKQITGKWGTA